MRKFLCALFIALLTLPATDALAKKKPVHVVVPKPYPVLHPVGVLAFVAPPLAVFYDLQRRTNCEGDTLGLGGPGFTTPITPATGNVMTTAYTRGQCPNVAPRN